LPVAIEQEVFWPQEIENASVPSYLSDEGAKNPPLGVG
jgi:hypothetical protein